MKRYTVKIVTEYGRGIYDGDEYNYLETVEDPSGRWVLAEHVEKLRDKIKRMQRRINELEGRI